MVSVASVVSISCVVPSWPSVLPTLPLGLTIGLAVVGHTVHTGHTVHWQNDPPAGVAPASLSNPLGRCELFNISTNNYATSGICALGLWITGEKKSILR